MPEFSFEECMEVSKVYSVAGLLNDKDGLVKNRPIFLAAIPFFHLQEKLTLVMLKFPSLRFL